MPSRKMRTVPERLGARCFSERRWRERLARNRRKHFSGEAQISYGNTIAVHPKNPDHVLCGGVDLHLTTNGGKRWKKVTRWDAKRGDANYAHSDHHHLLMPLAAPGRVYDTNDGGLDVSEDGGVTWSNRARVSKSPCITTWTSRRVTAVISGAARKTTGQWSRRAGHADDHFEILGGDGGWMIYEPGRCRRIFASYYNLNIWRWCNGRRVGCVAARAAKGKGFGLDGLCHDGSGRCAGRFSPEQSVFGERRTRGRSWKAVSPVLDGSAISAIEVARSDSRRVYVRDERTAAFFAVSTEGKPGAQISAGAALPGHEIHANRLHERAGLRFQF